MKLCPGAVQCTVFAFPNTDFFYFILEAKMVRWLVQSTKANISSCCVKMPFTLNILDLLGDLWNWTDQNPDVSKKPIKELIVKAKKVS